MTPQRRVGRADDLHVVEPPRLRRVMHLIHDLRRGGAEYVLVDLATAAAAAGIELSVVSMRPIEGFEYARRLDAAGVELATLGLAGWWDPAGPRHLRAAVSEWAPELLHSHLKHADVIAGRVATSLGIPHVSTLHLIEDEVGRVRALKRDLAIRSRLRTAARTVAVSEALRQWYLEVSGAEPGTVVTLHNGVPDPGRFDPDEIAAIREALGIPQQAVLAVIVAVIRPGKGHDTLIDAMSLVQNESVVVALAGDGESAARLQARAADLVVHPSHVGVLPTALVHALAAGAPIITTPVGGIPEMVTHDAGMLVARGDPVALAAAIDPMAPEVPIDAGGWASRTGSGTRRGSSSRTGRLVCVASTTRSCSTRSDRQPRAPAIVGSRR